MTVVVRFFAAARAAAGTETEKVHLADGAALAELLVVLRDDHGPDLAKVLERCSFLLDEVAVRDRTVPLTDGATVDVLPPFAGG